MLLLLLTATINGSTISVAFLVARSCLFHLAVAANKTATTDTMLTQFAKSLIPFPEVDGYGAVIEKAR